MIDEKELQLWISRLETEESSWNNYEKLAALYTIANQHKKVSLPEMPVMYSAAPAPEMQLVGEYGDSPFLQAVSKVSPEKAWGVMDELMDALIISNSRVYNSVMAKLGR